MKVTLTIYNDAKPDEAVRGCFAELIADLDRRVNNEMNGAKPNAYALLALREFRNFVQSITVECKPRQPTSPRIVAI